MRDLVLPAILTMLALALPVTAMATNDTGATIASQGNGQGAPACASCHGSEGEGMAAAGFPYLAGLPAAYIARELRAYAQGSRANPVMKPIASALSKSEIEAVAAHYSAQAPPQSAPSDGSSDDVALGERLVKHGNWSKGLPACVSCHGPGARGVADVFPSIAGQPAGYIRSQITAWQSGKRHNDPNGLMASVAEHMSAKEATAVADYLASIPAAP